MFHYSKLLTRFSPFRPKLHLHPLFPTLTHPFHSPFCSTKDPKSSQKFSKLLEHPWVRYFKRGPLSPQPEEPSNREVDEYQKILNDLDSLNSKTLPSREEVLNLLQIIIRLAKANQDRMKTPEAVKLYSEGLVLADKYGIADTIEIANIKQGLGSIYLSQGKLEEAEECLESAGKLFDHNLKVTDSKHPLLENTTLKATLYKDQNKLDEAYNMFKAILERIEAMPDPRENRNLKALAYDGLGYVHYKRKEYTKALEYWKNGLDFAVKEIGEDSVEVKGFYEMLAKGYYHEEKFPEAMEYGEKYINASMKHYGEDSPLVTASLSFMGKLHYKQESYNEAIEMYQQILDLLEKSSEKSPNQVIDTYMLMAKTYFYQGDLTKAHEYFNKAVELSRENFGDMNLKLADIFTAWAEVLRVKDETKIEAKNYYHKALKIYRNLTIVEESRVIDIYAYLGEIFYIEEDYDESRKQFEECLKLSIKEDKTDRVEEAYSFIGAIYMKQKKYEESIEAYKKAIEWCEKGENVSRKLHFHYHGLGEAYEKNGNVKQASEVYKKALDFDREKYGIDDNKTQKSLKSVLRTESKLDKKDQGEDSENEK